jgi:hypothetical protein
LICDVLDRDHSAISLSLSLSLSRNAAVGRSGLADTLLQARSLDHNGQILVPPNRSSTIQIDTNDFNFIFCNKTLKTWYEVILDFRARVLPSRRMYGEPGTPLRALDNPSTNFVGSCGIAVIFYNQIGEGNSTRLPNNPPSSRPPVTSPSAMSSTCFSISGATS